jgi:DNA-binding HxlR family transcriptional regulator
MLEINAHSRRMRFGELKNKISQFSQAILDMAGTDGTTK